MVAQTKSWENLLRRKLPDQARQQGFPPKPQLKSAQARSRQSRQQQALVGAAGLVQLVQAKEATDAQPQDRTLSEAT